MIDCKGQQQKLHILVVQKLHGMLELEFVIMVATIFVCCWTIGEVTDECHRDGGGREG